MKPALSVLWRYRKPLAVLCVCCWLAAATATHLPPTRLPQLGASDTLLHITGFAGLTGILVLTLTAYRVPRLRRMAMVVTLMAIYAGLDEITQPLTQRTADIRDWLADMFGMLLVLVVFEMATIFLARRRAARSLSQSNV